MQHRTQLTSMANPRVKELLGLRRRRSRDRTDVTLVEGYAELMLAVDAGATPRTLYHCPELTGGAAGQALLDRVTDLDTEVIEVSRAIFDRVAYRESPDGWLAVVPSVETDLARLSLGDRPLVLVCEGVEKPGNLGAILRTADAAGVAAVIAAGPVTDWANPNLVRASKGTLFSVPVASGSTDEVLQWLGAHDLAIVATTPDTDRLVSDVDLTGPTAIAVGSEKYGLSPRFLAEATRKARIPMFGRADSLNVATSAAIVTYEAVRQRMLASG
jgi:TrmH family RNA methyltransferase